MKIVKYIICPEHDKHIVRVETNQHNEYFTRETAKCPICNRRLEVKSEVKSNGTY